MTLAIKSDWDRPIATGPVILRLPKPPSTNKLFGTSRGKDRPKPRYRSNKYNAWRESAGWLLQEQHARRFIGEVEVAISVQEPPEHIRADIDNTIKATLDLIVHHGIIPTDDNTCVRKITAQWAPVIGCVVEIIPRERAAA